MSDDTMRQEAFARLDQLLGEWLQTEADVTVGPDSFVVRPKGEECFEVGLFDDQDDGLMIAAERWHAHYDDPVQIAFCAAWLLTPYYRIVHELKGGVMVAAWIERYMPDGWEAMDPVFYRHPEYAPDWTLLQGETFQRRTIQQRAALPPRPITAIVPDLVLDKDGYPPGSHFGARIETVDAPLGPTLYAMDLESADGE